MNLYRATPVAWVPAIAGVAGIIALLATVMAPAKLIVGAAVVLLLCLTVVRPAVLLSLVLGTYVLLDSDPGGPFGFAAAIYAPRTKLSVTPADLLVLLSAVSIVLARVREHGQVAGLGRLTIPAIGLILLTSYGAYNGLSAAASIRDVSREALPLLTLVLAAFAAVNWFDREARLSAAARFIAIVVVAKAGVALVALARGAGVEIRFTNGILTTSLAAATNWLAVTVVLGSAAAVVTSLVRPRRAVLVALLPTIALVLSYRRSFILAATFGLLIVLCAAIPTHPRARASIVLAGFIAGLVLGGAATDRGPLTDRGVAAGSLIVLSNFGGSRDIGDQYRAAERRNVWAVVADHPFTGLGLGLPWPQTQPLPAFLPTVRSYTHIAVLWYWLKFGFLGVALYLSLLVGTITTSWRAFRHAQSPAIGAYSLTICAAVAALALADTTASFAGVELRLSPLAGVVFGAAVAMQRLVDRAALGRTRSVSA